MARKRSYGEGQSTDLQGWEDQGCSDLSFMVVGHNHFLPLRLGWSTFVATCYLFIAGVPRRPDQESRQECYPSWCPPDFGWSLWCGNDVWHLEQVALFPQAKIRRKHGQIWSVIITAGPVTTVGVSWKDPIGPCGGNKEGSLLWRPEPQILVNLGP